MANISAVHYKWHLDKLGCTTHLTVTRHFTRRGIMEAYIANCEDDPTYTIAYIGEDVVVCEVAI